MQWLDDVYAVAFLATLAVGVLLYLATGSMYLVSMVAGAAHDLRLRRMLGPTRDTLSNTAVKVGDADYVSSQSEIRSDISSWGQWDAERGVYVVEYPESERRWCGTDLVHYYVWAKPPYVWGALKASPFTAAAAALLLCFTLGTVMWGGLHFGFAPGGLEQALWDKYRVTVDAELPEDPAVNETFRDVIVRIDAERSPRGEYEMVSGCTIDAGGGIETLTVTCPDEFGEMHELYETAARPKEWF